MRRISLQWTKDLKDKAARDAFEMKLRSMYSDPVMKRLAEILKEKHTANNKRQYDYATSAWPYQQAHINGQQELIEELLEMLLLTKET